MVKYTKEYLNSFVELTVLRACDTSVDVSIACQKAIRHGYAAVYVDPYHLAFAKRLLKEAPSTSVKVGTFVGSAVGSDPVKASAIQDVIARGAEEVETVINLPAIHDGSWKFVKRELNRISAICHQHDVALAITLPLPYLAKKELLLARDALIEARVDFINLLPNYYAYETYNTVRDIFALLNHTASTCKLKVEGAIEIYADVEEVIQNGFKRFCIDSKVNTCIPEV